MRVPARFDVDGDRRLGELAPQRLFEVVAHRVRIVHAHRAGNAQADVDEGQAPGVAGAQLVDVGGGAAGGGDDPLDAGDLFRPKRRVHQTGDVVVKYLLAAQLDVGRNQGGDPRDAQNQTVHGPKTNAGVQHTPRTTTHKQKV